MPSSQTFGQEVASNEVWASPLASQMAGVSDEGWTSVAASSETQVREAQVRMKTGDVKRAPWYDERLEGLLGGKEQEKGKAVEVVAEG